MQSEISGPEHDEQKGVHYIYILFLYIMNNKEKIRNIHKTILNIC